MRINVAVVQTRSGNVLMQVGEDTALGSLELGDVVQPAVEAPAPAAAADAAELAALRAQNAELRAQLSPKVE